jgi:large subunit ribosomal protein L35
MPKMRTHSGAKKRFIKKKSGKFKITGAYHRHLLSSKSAKRKRKMRNSKYVASVERHHLVVLLPN